MTTLVVFIPLLSFLLGLALLVCGLRGRKVDDHPICRGCGFDLFNRPETSERCPECGADLHAARAIQIGRRQRRRGLVITGGGMVGAVVGLALTGGYFALSSSDWRTKAPVWWLRYEANSVDPKSRDAALAELNSRVTAGKLSQAQIDDLADRALAYQADKSNTWVPAWGDFVEAAQGAGKLSQPRFGKYLEQAMNLQLEVRPQITRGDRLYYWIREGPARVGGKSRYYVHYAQSWEVGAMHRADNGGSGTSMSVIGGGGTGTAVNFKPDEIRQLKEGENEIVMHMDVKFGTGWNTPTPPLHTSKVDLRGKFVVHPPGESTVKIIHDPTLRSAVEAGVKCTNLNYSQPWNPKHLSAQIQLGKTPCGLAYDVYAVIAGKEVKLGSFARSAATSDYGYGFGNEVPPFSAAKLDLVLKPSVDAAIGTTDTFEMWDEQIVLKDVPVTRPTSSPAPAPAAAAPVKK